MLQVVELEGSFLDIGRGWGRAFRDAMPAVLETELGGVAAVLGVDAEAVIGLAAPHREAAQAFDPDSMLVLQGFAEGAGIGFEAAFALRCVLEVLFQTAAPPGMCTSFAVAGAATASGEAIIGQNVDWHPGLPLALLRITWPGGVRQLCLSVGGVFEYSLTQPPDAAPYGVAATLTATPSDTLPPTKDAPRGGGTVPVSITMNRASRQPDMDAALAVFRDAGISLGSFLLAGGGAEPVGIELGLGGHALLRPEGGVLVHANHLLTPRLTEQDIFLPFVPDSPLRRERLARLIQDGYDRLTPRAMMDCLKDHEGHPRGLCTHVDPDSDLPPTATIASLVMEPQEGVMHIAAGTPCTAEYADYTLRERGGPGQAPRGRA